jgi:alpha-tubulin suppressor-like RCC1 family protein
MNRVSLVLACVGCGRIDFAALIDGSSAGDGSAARSCQADSDCGACGRCDANLCRAEQITELFMGHTLTCFIGLGGSRWCTGQNDTAELGLGDTVPHNTWTRIPGEDQWAALYLDYSASWGMKSDGHLYHWPSPQLLPEDAGVVPNLDHIATDNASCYVYTDHTVSCDPTSMVWPHFDLGTAHQCGIAASGALYCWGTDRKGSLGLGPGMIGATVTNPSRVGTDTDWADVGAGDQQTCAVKTNGTMWCWGFAELTGTNGVDTNATPTQIDAATDWTAILVHFVHACGQKSDGSVYCWGHDIYGGLVVPNLSNAPVPMLASTGQTRFITGGHASCRLVGGQWSCYGGNFKGQLGLGNTNSPINDYTPICP